MKKFLLITYYWPPSGGAGVIRWVKHCKYIGEFGWEPIIYTPENPHFPVLDDSMMGEVDSKFEVLKLPIWEPYEWYKKFTGRKKEERIYSGFINEHKKESLAQKIAVFIRGNFFIPDARKFWIKPSVKFLSRVLKERDDIEAIITTGPPNSMHMIGLGLKKKMPDLKWIADFRDPWTRIDFYDRLRLTKLADRKHHRLERQVLNMANEVVTVTWSWADDFRHLGRRADIKVITNGFDPLDFETDAKQPDTNIFSIVHLGSMNRDRNIPALWAALAELVKENEDFSNRLRIVLIGQNDRAVIEAVEGAGLGTQLVNVPYVPHSEAVKRMQQAHLLLLPVNNAPNVSGYVPGKLFEYLGACRPILCISPSDIDVRKVVDPISSVYTAEYEDQASIKEHIANAFEDYLDGSLKANTGDISNYSRKTLAGMYATLLNNLVI